ncbi:MAG: DUF4390 domain-containing protein [Candidatus Marinimicrobia bacterium]|nr:DUF4390 domain-containing protein [Candidatus Neomarinimicrobiota bacterium]
MDPGIFTNLFQKTINAVIAIGSLFYSTIDGVRADFTLLDVDVSHNIVIVSTQLINCFSDDLDQIFRSGERVSIYYKLELISDQNNQPIYQKNFSHSIRYSLLEKTYDVYKSEIETVLIGLDFIQAKNEMSQIIAFPTIDVEQLKSNIVYHFRITAWMDNIQLQGMDKPLNLMYYWSSIRPVNDSPEFQDMISLK